jgi:SAM-dependent methyltransferase
VQHRHDPRRADARIKIGTDSAVALAGQQQIGQCAGEAVHCVLGMGADQRIVGKRCGIREDHAGCAALVEPRALGEMYRVTRPGGSLMIAEFRPPQGHLARHLVGALTSPAMARNPLHLLEPMIAGAGFGVTGRGDLRPWIHWVRAERAEHAPAGS